jgi:sugar phosphate permease
MKALPDRAPLACCRGVERILFIRRSQSCGRVACLSTHDLIAPQRDGEVAVELRLGRDGHSDFFRTMKIRGLRWWIVVLVFLAAVLNYVDRQTLSALAPTIQADLKMDDRDYANIVNVFLVAYTLAYLISGKLVDKLGTRKGTAVFVIWWSLANMVTAWAQGIRSMGTCRFLLGLGEAGIWPAASKAVSEWFPARERALAIGFYTMGATIGATVAPYIVIRSVSYTHLRAHETLS